METTESKRKKIEGLVSGHSQFSKVSDYLAEKYNLDKSETYRKFIDFLVREDFDYYDNMPHNVLCFEFDKNNGEFINRTLRRGIGNPI